MSEQQLAQWFAQAEENPSDGGRPRVSYPSAVTSALEMSLALEQVDFSRGRRFRADLRQKMLTVEPTNRSRRPLPAAWQIAGGIAVLALLVLGLSWVFSSLRSLTGRSALPGGPLETASPAALPALAPLTCPDQGAVPTEAAARWPASARVAAGGTVQGDGFTFSIYLYCDANLSPQGSGDRYSEVAGLGILRAWTYSGAAVPGALAESFGPDPYVDPLTGWAAGLKPGDSGGGAGGVTFPRQDHPDRAYPDWSKPDQTVRFVLKVGGPAGYRGIQLSVRFVKQADGIHISDTGSVNLGTGTLLPATSVPPAAPPAEPSVTTTAAAFITIAGDGVVANLRSGPATTYPVVGSLKSGQTAPALGKTSQGGWFKVAFPPAQGGAAWVYGALVTVSGDVPVVDQAAAERPGLQAGEKRISLASAPADIRQLMLKPAWFTLWIEGQSIDTPDNGLKDSFYVQAWLDRASGGRVISSDQTPGVSGWTADIQPRWAWLSDGKTLQIYDAKTKTFDLEAVNQRWTDHPLEMAGELPEMFFFSAPRADTDQNFTILREETFIGRPALVLDWGIDRLWVDEASGVILRRQTFSGLDHSGQSQQEKVLTKIVYDPTLPADLLDHARLNPLRFEDSPVLAVSGLIDLERAKTAIRAFTGKEVVAITYEGSGGAIDPALPDLKLNRFTADGAEYDLDASTNQVRQVQAVTGLPPGTHSYTQNELLFKATQLVQSQEPGIDLTQYTFEQGSKPPNFFFRWSKGPQGDPGYAIFVQVGLNDASQLVSYTNSLPSTASQTPAATPTPAPSATPVPTQANPTQAAPITLSGRIYFSIFQNGTSTTRTGWLSLDCLARSGACPGGVQILPGSFQRNMTSPIVWSPDGRRFVLVSNLDGNNDLTLVNADGSGAVNLTHSPDAEDETAWSPDGSQILYHKRAGGADPAAPDEIWILRPDGSGARKLADGYRAVWSADGARVLSIRIDPSNGKFVLDITGQAGGSPVWEKTVAENAGVGSIAWSPDGGRILLCTSGGLLIYHLDGSATEQLAPDLSGFSHAAWSPDGQTIAFIASTGRAAPPNLYTIRADGSGLTNVSHTPDGAPILAAWSPDGRWLLYDSLQGSGHWNLVISSPDGVQQVQLTRSDGNTDYNDPCWQP